MNVNEMLKMTVADYITAVTNQHLDTDSPSVIAAGDNSAALPWAIIVAVTRTSVDNVVEALIKCGAIGPTQAVKHGKHNIHDTKEM